MNQDSREKNSVRNLLVGITYQVVILGLNLFSKAYFIHILGTTYLGLNGLFTNIFLVLSFAEHGVGPVMMYALYGPFASRDKGQIRILYHYFKRIYHRLAILIAGLGLVLMPLLPYMVNSDEPLERLGMAFVVYLAGIVISNLSAYKSHLIVSDQKKYLVEMYQFAFEATALIVQVFCLIAFKSYLVYLLVFLVKNVVFALMLTRLVRRHYGFVYDSYEEDSGFSREKELIKHKIKNIILYRFSRVLLTGTDNIIISILVGTVWVGFYTNYDFVIVGVTMLVSTFYSAITASVGNLIAKERLEDQNKAFDIIQGFVYWLVAFTTTALVFLIQDFISLWLGGDLLLDPLIVAVIIFNYYLICNRSIIKVFRNATGAFDKIKHMMFLAALMNIVLSIGLGYYFGLIGVLLATSISTLATFYWYEAKIVLVEKLKRPFRVFLINQVKTGLLTGVTITITGLLIKNIYFQGLTGFVLKLAMVVIISNVLLAILLHKTKAFGLAVLLIRRKG